MFEIEIDEELSNYIESLQYETDSRKDIIIYMITNNMDLNTEVGKQYQKEYSNFYNELAVAKDNLSQMYIRSNPKFADKDVTWNLDFHSHTLYVKVQ